MVVSYARNRRSSPHAEVSREWKIELAISAFDMRRSSPIFSGNVAGMEGRSFDSAYALASAAARAHQRRQCVARQGADCRRGVGAGIGPPQWAHAAWTEAHWAAHDKPLRRQPEERRSAPHLRQDHRINSARRRLLHKPRDVGLHPARSSGPCARNACSIRCHKKAAGAVCWMSNRDRAFRGLPPFFRSRAPRASCGETARVRLCAPRADVW